MLPSLIDVPRGQLSLTRVPGQNGTVAWCRVCHNTAPLPAKLLLLSEKDDEASSSLSETC